MRRVVRHEDVLATIAQRPVPKQKSMPTNRQILTVRCRQTIGHDGDSEPILRSIPPRATQIAAGLHTVVHFGIRKRLVVALVPAGAREHAHKSGERVFGVHTDSRLYPTRPSMGDDVWLRIAAG